MSEARGSQVGTLLITGLLAILGTVAGGVIKGYWDSSLAETKFQTDLIMKSLEAEEQEARINSLRFMIETNLIANPKIRRGLEEYLNGNPTDAPQFIPTAVASLSRVVVPSTQETMGFTDFDVFVCDASWMDEQENPTAQSVIDTLKQAGHVGQIRLKKWLSYDEVPLESLRNKLTIVVDEGHGESAELPSLMQQFQAVDGLPEIQVLNNPGRTSAWLISIITCS